MICRRVGGTRGDGLGRLERGLTDFLRAVQLPLPSLRVGDLHEQSAASPLGADHCGSAFILRPDGFLSAGCLCRQLPRILPRDQEPRLSDPTLSSFLGGGFLRQFTGQSDISLVAVGPGNRLYCLCQVQPQAANAGVRFGRGRIAVLLRRPLGLGLGRWRRLVLKSDLTSDLRIEPGLAVEAGPMGLKVAPGRGGTFLNPDPRKTDRPCLTPIWRLTLPGAGL